MFVLSVRPNQKRYTISFSNFESYWCFLSNQQVRLSLQNVMFDIISKQCPLTNLLNYFIIIGKLFLLDWRRNQKNPKIRSYQNKLAKEREISKKGYFTKNGYLALTRNKINMQID